MKKKILAMLLAGALAISGAVGFSACGDDVSDVPKGDEVTDGGIPKGDEANDVSIPEGDEVTEAEWKECIGNTLVNSEYGYLLNLTDFTFEGSVNTEATVDGTRIQHNVMIDPTTGELIVGEPEEVDFKATTKWAEGRTALLKDDGYYYEILSDYGIEGKQKDEDISSSRKSVSKRYTELRDGNDENHKYWRAGCYKYESSDDPYAGGEPRFDYRDWSAEAVHDLWFESDYSVCLSDCGQFTYNWFVRGSYYVSKHAGKGNSISDLYGQFAYSEGRYTATLYRSVRLYGESSSSYNGPVIVDDVACTVTLSFDKTEKCITGFRIQSDEEGTISEEGSYNLKYTYKENSVFVISDLNSTDPAVKKNEDITKAIEKAKKELEENS